MEYLALLILIIVVGIIAIFINKIKDKKIKMYIIFGILFIFLLAVILVEKFHT